MEQLFFGFFDGHRHQTEESFFSPSSSCFEAQRRFCFRLKSQDGTGVLRLPLESVERKKRGKKPAGRKALFEKKKHRFFRPSMGHRLSGDSLPSSLPHLNAAALSLSHLLFGGPPPPFCRNHLHAGVSTDPSSAQGPALTEEPAMTGVFQVRDREERTREERRRREREREKDREEEENRSRVVVVVVVDLSSQNLSLQKHTHTSSVRHPRRPQPGPRRQALLRHLPGRRPPLERPLLPEGQQGRPDLPLRQRRRRRGLGRRGRGLLADERPRRRRRAPRPSFGRLGPAPRLVQALAPPPLGRRGPRRQQGRHPHLRAPLRRLGLHQLCAAGRRARGVCAPGRLGRRAVRAVDGPERGAPGAAAESDARGAALRLPQGDGAR